MTPGTWGLIRRLCGWPMPLSPRLSGCNQSNSPVPLFERTAAFLGPLVAIVSLAWVNVAMADEAVSGRSTLSVRVDATQSEFERLMAVARNTRQGMGSKVHRLDIKGRPAIGAEEAPLILIEIASFECPYCRRHWLDTMPALRQQFIDNGQLRYVFVDVVLDPEHKHAGAATKAAHCANEQGRYIEFRNRIFKNQKAIDAVFLEAHAEAIALDLPDFRRCMKSDRHKVRVDDDTSLARELRVRGTPSFFWARADSDRTDVQLVRRVTGVRRLEEFAQQYRTLEKHNQGTAAALVERMR